VNSIDLKVSDEVQAALDTGRAVVALESSLIAHGFPRPDNLDLARTLEAAVRARGAVPATIALLDGRARIGLDAGSLARLAQDASVAKCSVRDLAYLLATGGSGGTTVAATARLAAAAGIAVFATGGIGGVHRRGGRPFDVSADLVELARAAVAVVTSGAKVLLDLPATLEVLETQGVPVVGYRTGEFPGFYAAASGLTLAQRCDDLTTLATVVRTHLGLGAGGLLVCNPPPAALALAPAEVEALVETALGEAARDGIAGPAVTPYVLTALGRLSGGRTRIVNRALILANAELGADLAVALAAGARPISPSSRGAT
jgi:pseudouridine-5'-phosphate glycosidase